MAPQTTNHSSQAEQRHPGTSKEERNKALAFLASGSALIATIALITHGGHTNNVTSADRIATAPRAPLVESGKQFADGPTESQLEALKWVRLLDRSEPQILTHPGEGAKEVVDTYNGAGVAEANPDVAWALQQVVIEQGTAVDPKTGERQLDIHNAPTVPILPNGLHGHGIAPGQEVG